MTGKFVKTAVVSGVLMTLAPGGVPGAPGAPIAKKGSTSYTVHYVSRPLGSFDIPGVGKAWALELIGPTENTKGDAVFDKMHAWCFAVSVESGGKKWMDGGCRMTDIDGDLVFSTFDTRDLDKSQPKMDCGTHIIGGGTGKYAGITGREPFACVKKPTPAGEPHGSTAMDVTHNASWEFKGVRRQR